MKRNRFLHLEGQRPERDASASGPASRARFEALGELPGEGSPSTDEPEAPGARPGTEARFAPPPPPLSLAEREGDVLPFLRCLDCGVDSNRFAVRCQHCGADLTTAGQLAFQEQVARERAEALEHEAAARAQLDHARASSQAEADAARRAYGEALATSTRKRFDRQYRGADASGRRSVGARMLSLIPAPWHGRVLGGGALVLVVLFLIGRFTGRTHLSTLAVLCAVLSALTFIPARASFWERMFWDRW